MKVLIACEESQQVCMAFRKLGAEAYSCDIIDCSGGHPEWHIKQDVLTLLNGNCTFLTTDNIEHRIEGEWDLIIAHPPCTFLTVTGNRWFNIEKYGEKAIKRCADHEDAVKFFMEFTEAKCKHIAIENPVGIMSTRWRKPDQIIQPYYFGDPFEKKTCLWLIRLPELKKTNIVQPEPREVYASGKSCAKWYADAWKLPKEERAKVRSKTFQGFADAMAHQWIEFINHEKQEKIYE